MLNGMCGIESCPRDRERIAELRIACSKSVCKVARGVMLGI